MKGPLVSVIIVALLSAIGWVMNVYKFATSFESFGEMGSLEIIQLVGIFLAPLGSVLGWIIW